MPTIPDELPASGLEFPALLTNSVYTSTYPGKNSKKGSPSTTRAAVLGMNAILRISSITNISIIRRSFGNLIFKKRSLLIFAIAVPACSEANRDLLLFFLITV
jgi:hypothetical protein